MNTHGIIKLSVGVLALVVLIPTAFADDMGMSAGQNNLYTNAGFLAGDMSLQADNGTGGSSTTSLFLVGGDGSFGFDNLFPAGKYLNVTGSVLVGGDSSNTMSFSGLSAGVGGHIEFEPVIGNVDIGKISIFGSYLENYDYITVSEPSYTFNGQTYGGDVSSSNSNGALEYGVKWLILNVYEWDFYGINGSSSSSSGSSQSNSPISGNSINLKFKWLLEPKRKSPYLGVYYQHQTQTGSTANTIMVIGGYVW